MVITTALKELLPGCPGSAAILIAIGDDNVKLLQPSIDLLRKVDA